jgi:hypothetical protein
MSFKEYLKEVFAKVSWEDVNENSEQKDYGTTTLSRDEMIEKIKRLTGNKGSKKAEDMSDDELRKFYLELRHDMIHAKRP